MLFTPIWENVAKNYSDLAVSGIYVAFKSKSARPATEMCNLIQTTLKHSSKVQLDP